MATGIIGIPDPWIWTAYLLCLAATALCVIHAAVRGRKSYEAEQTPVDAAWAKRERETEEED